MYVTIVMILSQPPLSTPVVIVTAAGRRRYLEILARYVASLVERSLVAGWQLWLNTENDDDLGFCEALAQRFPWIVLQRLTVPCQGVPSVSTFYRHAQTPGTVYVKLDDDVVFLDVEAFGDFVRQRVENRRPLLLFANTVNNAICTHIQQRRDAISRAEGLVAYNASCPLGHGSPEFAEALHRQFLRLLEQVNLRTLDFGRWVVYRHERVSINAVAWLGEDMSPLLCDLHGHPDDEHYLTCEATMKFRRDNELYGRFVVSHFAFFTQRAHLDTTNLLSIYATRAMSCVPGILL